MSHRILIVDDHPLFRRGVAQLLTLVPDVEVVGEAGDFDTALKLAREHEPDLTLLDVNLKGRDGLQILAALKAEDPSCRVVMLTVSDAPEDLASAVRAGADGYLLKEMEPEVLVARLRDALNGHIVVSDTLLQTVTQILATDDAVTTTSRDVRMLTERERAVLCCVAEGQSNKDIAVTLGITEGTVKVHVKHLLKKLAFRSRVEAAVWATQKGARITSAG